MSPTQNTNASFSSEASASAAASATATAHESSSAARRRPLSCFSALKHRAAAQNLYIPGEDPAQFEALVEEAFEQYQPATILDASFVYDSVHARWMLWRRQRAQSDLEQNFNQTFGDASCWSKDQFHLTQLCDRYVTSAERSLNRALSNLRAVRKDESQQARWRDLHCIHRERLALQREKFEFAKQKEERRIAKAAAKAAAKATKPAPAQSTPERTATPRPPVGIRPQPVAQTMRT